MVGYLRYDTERERTLMNSLYENELRLYKNFFSPVMKLKRKIRIGSKVKREYGIPKTPYQRLIESGQISETAKRELRILYQTLNPAELKRTIDRKTHELYKAYAEKRKGGEVTPFKKQTPRTVTSFMIQRSPSGLPHDMI